MPGIRRNIGFLLLTQGVNIAAALLLLAMVARYLGVERFGQLTVLRSIALFALPLLTGGLRLNIIRETARDPEGAPAYLGSIITLRWCLGFGAALAAAGVVRLLPLSPDLESASYAAILLALAGVWQSVPSAILVAYERNEYNLLMSTINNLLTILLTAIAIRLDTGVAGIIFASAIPSFLVAQAAQLLISRRLVRPILTIDLHHWRRFMKSALPLGVSGLLRRSYARIDIWLLAVLQGAAAAALFSIAYRLVTEVTNTSRFISSAILPRISMLAHARRDDLRTAVERLLLILLSVSVPAAGVMAACAAPALTLLVGPQFEGSITALRLVSVVCVTALPDALLFYVLVALRKEMVATACLLATVIANAILDLILIPLMGVRGACFGTIGAEWTYFALALLLVHRALRISSFWQFIGKPVVAGAGMALAVWMAGPHRPVLGALAGLSAFAFLFVLLRVRPRESIRTLRTALAVRPGDAGTGAQQPLPASNSEYD